MDDSDICLTFEAQFFLCDKTGDTAAQNVVIYMQYNLITTKASRNVYHLETKHAHVTTSKSNHNPSSTFFSFQPRIQTCITIQRRCIPGYNALL